MTSTVTPEIEPRDLGLPPKFSQWRPGQFSSVLAGVESPTRFVAQCAPTGSGKSLLAVASSILLGTRTVILTSTKGLQSQYDLDFSSCGLADLRGRQNYPCSGVDSPATCAEGRILGCKLMGKPDCPHSAAKEQFLDSQLCVSNYSCYFSNVMHGDGMGDIGLLILDEAHHSLEELSEALTIHLDHSKSAFIYRDTGITPPYGSPLSHWRAWASSVTPQVKSYFARLKASGSGGKRLSVVDSFLSDLTRIATVPDDWILDETVSSDTVFAPLWPTDYAESVLFRGIKKVMLVSATIVPKTLDLLGIKQEESLFISHPHSFDPRRSPVYLFGASRIDHKATEGQLQEMVARMDSLISRRLDRKGLIHTVSYDRQNFIMNNSEHRDIMIAPKGQGLHEAVRVFRESPPPRILISPAITTGYDFPASDCEYQIILKVPFIDARSPIMKARSEADPEYIPYLVAQTLTQECGRAMRGSDDQNENFILDQHANWFLKPKARNGQRGGGYRHLFPGWFLKQVQYPDGQPRPPKPL